MKRIDLIGTKIHKLEVLEELKMSKTSHRKFKCICECGNFVNVWYSHIRAGSQKSCGCLLDRPGTQSKYFKGVGQITYSWWRGHVLRQNKSGNSRQKREVTVTIEQAWDLFQKQQGKCALSGIALVFSNIHRRNGEDFGRQDNTASLDRIDNTKDYSLDNIQWVHKHINFMKRDHTNSYFIELCKQIARHNDNREETKFIP